MPVHAVALLIGAVKVYVEPVDPILILFAKLGVNVLVFALSVAYEQEVQTLI